MKKMILTGIAFVVIVFLPRTESLAGGFSVSPNISLEIGWGQPYYDDIWVDGYWTRRRGHWVWIEGYRERKMSKAYWKPRKWRKNPGYRGDRGRHRDRDRDRDRHRNRDRRWDTRYRDRW